MKKDDLLFIHKFLKAIGDSFVKVFIPLYILKITSNLTFSITYLSIYSVLVLLLNFLLKKIIEKFGIQCIFAHFLFIIGSYCILSFAEINWLTLCFTAVLMAFAQTLYSVPLNILFSCVDKKTNVGKFEIPSNIGKLVFTLISGLLLDSSYKNSFILLCIISSIIYIGSMIPLIFTYWNLKTSYASSKVEVVEKVKIDKLFICFHILFGVFQPIMDNILPLYLYVNDLSFTAVTIMIVLVELFKIGINIFANYLKNKKLSIICVSIGFGICLVSIVCLIIFKNPVVLYIFSTAYSICFPFTFVPMFGLYCKFLKKSNNYFNGMVIRDIDIFSCRPLLYVSSFLPIGLISTFIIGIAVLPAMFFTEIKLLKKYDNDCLCEPKIVSEIKSNN